MARVPAMRISGKLKLVSNATRAYCAAWGDGLDRTSSDEDGMCETSLRLKFCNAFPIG